MDQDQINHLEWKNPDNWSGPKWASAYFSRKDSRTVVPKRIPLMGWTVNLGRNAGVFRLILVLVGIPLLTLLIVLLKASPE